MPAFIDITGQKYGRLTAIRMVGQDKFRSAIWLFACECGTEVARVAHSVRKGNTKSCGCLHKDVMSAIKTTHGKRKQRLYTIYAGMKSRCYTLTNSAFKFYGAKGITVCDEWLNNPSAFFEWALANGYQDNLSIDRIDSKKGYSPDNCQWITISAQQSNRSNNVLIAIDGETKTQSQWMKQLNVPRHIINYYRFNLGLSPEQAIQRIMSEGRKVCSS